MRKTILLGIALILTLSLLSSCTGVSQEDYDRVSNDLAAAQTQIQSLQADLMEAQEQIQSLQDDLTTVQTELSKAQEQIQSLKSDNAAINSKSATALGYAEFLDIAMLRVWNETEGIEPRFFFRDQETWLAKMRTRAEYMQDTNLINAVEGVQYATLPDFTYLIYYCLGKIEEVLD